MLHRVESADTVAFLDFDHQELASSAKREREAMSLLIQAARLVGSRDKGGRVVQTRIPQHPVLQAVNADLDRWPETELEVRKQLRQPPEAHWAIISASADQFIQRLGSPESLEIRPANENRWRIRCDDRQELVDHLKNVDRPSGRLRIEINPLRA